MGLASKLYNNVLKKTSTYAVALVFSAFLFERSFDQGTEYLFENMNQGKLWKHIKHNYEEK